MNDTPRVNPDLTCRNSRSHARSTAWLRNAGVCFHGRHQEVRSIRHRRAIWPGRMACGLPANPNGQPNADVLKPWINGMDLTRRPAGKWIIDFGSDHERSRTPRFTKHRSAYVSDARQANRGGGASVKEHTERIGGGIRARAPSINVAGTGRPDPVHRHASRRQAPAVRLARFARMS